MLRQLATSSLLAIAGLASLAAPAAARTRPHYGGTLRVDTSGDPWQRPAGMAHRLVFDGLTKLDSNGAVRPALAIDWQSENANHRWQFHLRPGVHFHDGTLLTPLAVVASLNVSCPSNCPWTSVRTTASAVVFNGDAPMPNLPALLASDDFLIALTISAEGKTPESATGTGPFQVNGFNNGVLSLVANDTCWQGRSFLDAIEIRVHRSISDQWLDLSSSRTDIVEVPAEEIRQAQLQHFVVLASPPVQLLTLKVTDSGALANLNLRAAISNAIDRSALANVIFQKQAQAAASLLPQSLSGYAFLFPPERDLKKAQQLRGGITPPQLSLRTDGNAAMQLAAQRIILNLREAGFNVQPAAPGNQHADLNLVAVELQSASPSAALEMLTRGQDRWTPVDSDPIAEYKAERGLLDRKTIIPLLHLPHAYASGPRVRDLQLRSDGSLDLAEASLEAAP